MRFIRGELFPILQIRGGVLDGYGRPILENMALSGQLKVILRRMYFNFSSADSAACAVFRTSGHKHTAITVSRYSAIHIIAKLRTASLRTEGNVSIIGK